MSLPEEVALEWDRCGSVVPWELRLGVRWLLLLLLRLRLLPPSAPRSLLMLLQALWPREDRDSLLSSSPPSSRPSFFSFSLSVFFLSLRGVCFFLASSGGTRLLGRCRVERNDDADLPDSGEASGVLVGVCRPLPPPLPTDELVCGDA